MSGSKEEHSRGRGDRERGEEERADGKGPSRGSHRHSALSWQLFNAQLRERMTAPYTAGARGNLSARTGHVAAVYK